MAKTVLSTVPIHQTLTWQVVHPSVSRVPHLPCVLPQNAQLSAMIPLALSSKSVPVIQHAWLPAVVTPAANTAQLILHQHVNKHIVKPFVIRVKVIALLGTTFAYHQMEHATVIVVLSALVQIVKPFARALPQD